MTPKQVYEYFGNYYQFGKKTKMSPCSLKNWVKWGFIPIESQHKIEQITEGRLKVHFEKKSEAAQKVLPIQRDRTEELLFIMGVSLPIVMSYAPTSDRDKKVKQWILTAIDNIVYKNEKLPEFLD